MVGGRKNIDLTMENSSEANFPEWLYNHLDQEQEAHIQIEEESDIKIAKILNIIGLWCIQWYPIDGPSIKVVVEMRRRQLSHASQSFYFYGTKDNKLMLEDAKHLCN